MTSSEARSNEQVIKPQEADGYTAISHEKSPKPSSAASVTVSTAPNQEAGPGSTPRAALQRLQARPIPLVLTKKLLVREHYLHSLPGGTKLCFGAFLGSRLMGALTLGVGPANAFALVDRACPDDCLTLSRLWLSDELPKNSESRFIGLVRRSLRKHTSVKFLISYADPAQGHAGIIYQASNWSYTGLSQATPLYDLGDGRQRHSRTLSHCFGSHGLEHFRRHGIEVRLVPQAAKHRYLYFLDPTWRGRLRTPTLPYPKKEAADASG